MNLNIIPNGAIKRVHVSQNDVGRTLTFELFNNSTSYTIPSGATVKIQGTKPSGFGFSETCTVSGNVATIDTTEAMTDEFGYIEAELQITNSGDVLGTSNFILAVERNPHPSNTTDGTQITAQSLQVQINELRDEIESGGSGLTDGAKQALLNCFAHVAWIDADGQDYYDALESALYPPADLVSISAVYTQSGTVYDTDSLDVLKDDLVVTAHYDNGTTQTVTSYTLSGTLEVGTSTITVLYGGQTTTFDVTVTHATLQYSITNNLTYATNSNNASVINELTTYTATLTADANYILNTVVITMGGTDVTSTVYDDTDGSITIASVTGNIVITATAIEDLGWISGQAYDVEWTSGYDISTSGVYENNSYKITDYLPCRSATAIKCEGTTPIVHRAYYDENQTYIGASATFYSDVGERHIMPPTNAYYVRVATKTTDTLTLVPYLYPNIDESTVWQSGQIYLLDTSTNGTSDLALCFGATTINMLVDGSIYGYRGSYSLYDSAKQRTNSMGNTNNFTRTPITVSATDYYFSLYSTSYGSEASRNNVILVKLT